MRRTALRTHDATLKSYDAAFKGQDVALMGHIATIRSQDVAYLSAQISGTEGACKSLVL